MLIFGYDLAKAPWSMIGYILVSIVALVYGTTYVNSINQVRGVIFGIGLLLIILYYGIKLFGSKIPQLKSWPPVINTCPDYLSYISIPSTTVNGKKITGGCVDMLGVTTSSSANAIQKTEPSTATSFKGGATTDISKKLFEFTSADVKNATKATDLQAICARCQDMGITWEGVYDGDACIGITTSANAQAAVEQCLLSV